jgi:hypothetical protein
MILPFTVDPHIVTRVSLDNKPSSPKNRTAPCIRRHVPRLQPVKVQLTKRIFDRRSNRLRHQPTSFHGLVQRIPHKARLQRTANDFRKMDPTNDTPSIRLEKQKHVCRLVVAKVRRHLGDTIFPKTHRKKRSIPRRRRRREACLVANVIINKLRNVRPIHRSKPQPRRLQSRGRSFGSLTVFVHQCPPIHFSERVNIQTHSNLHRSVYKSRIDPSEGVLTIRHLVPFPPNQLPSSHLLGSLTIRHRSCVA